MNELLTELQATLSHEIPLTTAMGVQVAAYDSKSLTLKAPLAPNINHKETAFAGSLNSLATLAGWSLFWLILKEETIAAKIVIQDSQVSYLHPVNAEITVTCAKPAPEEISRCLYILRRKKLARLELEAEIRQGQALAVRFRGRYVAQLVTLGF